MAMSKNIILHHIDLFYKLRYLFGAFKIIWPMTPNLGFYLQIWVFNTSGFFFWRSVFFFRI